MGARAAGSFLHDWPAAIRDLWRQTVASLALPLAGAVAGDRLAAADGSWFDAIVPAGLAGGRGPEASAESLRAVLYGGGDEFLSAHYAELRAHLERKLLLGRRKADKHVS